MVPIGINAPELSKLQASNFPKGQQPGLPLYLGHSLPQPLLGSCPLHPLQNFSSLKLHSNLLLLGLRYFLQRRTSTWSSPPHILQHCTAPQSPWQAPTPVLPNTSVLQGTLSPPPMSRYASWLDHTNGGGGIPLSLCLSISTWHLAIRSDSGVDMCELCSVRQEGRFTGDFWERSTSHF